VIGKVKVKVVPRHEHISKALRYDMRSLGIDVTAWKTESLLAWSCCSCSAMQYVGTTALCDSNAATVNLPLIMATAADFGKRL